MHLNQTSYTNLKREIEMPKTTKKKAPERPFVITIDGPAASGKTTVSRELARKLGFQWVSTGAFYRGLAFVATRLNYDLSDEKKIADLAQSKRWAVKMEEEETKVLFEGENVTHEIMTEKVAAAASQISQYPLVRHELLPLQRACGDRARRGLIAEGRDCGTTVFPEAQLKVYLTAASENRARRRAIQQGGDLNRIKENQSARDLRDSKRATSPLQVADNSKVLDTRDMTLMDAVETISGWARKIRK
jgi:cytidylate kinase